MTQWALNYSSHKNCQVCYFLPTLMCKLTLNNHLKHRKSILSLNFILGIAHYFSCIYQTLQSSKSCFHGGTVWSVMSRKVQLTNSALLRSLVPLPFSIIPSLNHTNDFMWKVMGQTRSKCKVLSDAECRCLRETTERKPSKPCARLALYFCSEYCNNEGIWTYPPFSSI